MNDRGSYPDTVFVHYCRYGVQTGSGAYPASNIIGTKTSLYVSKEAVEHFCIKYEEIQNKTREAIPLFPCMSQLCDA